LEADQEKVETLKAELDGDDVRVAQVKLAAAQHALQRVSDLAGQKVVSASEAEAAQAEVQMREAELKAAQATQNRHAVFGPVIERTIYDCKSGKDWLLNLATGETFLLPAGLDWDRNAAAIWQWAHQHGVHVTGFPMVNQNEKTDRVIVIQTQEHQPPVVSQPAVYGFEMKAAIPLDANTAFENLTPLQISNALQGAPARRNYGPDGNPWLLQLTGADLQNLFAFQTDDGQSGVLQVIGVTGNLRGVKIRYKLVQMGKN